MADKVKKVWGSIWVIVIIAVALFCGSAKAGRRVSRSEHVVQVSLTELQKAVIEMEHGSADIGAQAVIDEYVEGLIDAFLARQMGAENARRMSETEKDAKIMFYIGRGNK